MSRLTYNVQAPPGVLPWFLCVVSHPAWASDHLYAQGDSCSVVLPGDADPTAFTGGLYVGEAAQTDANGIDARNCSVIDTPEFALWTDVELLRGNIVPIDVILLEYLSTDSTTPVNVSTLTMEAPSRKGLAISFLATTVRTISRDAPTRLFTFGNSPSLRYP